MIAVLYGVDLAVSIKDTSPDRKVKQEIHPNENVSISFYIEIQYSGNRYEGDATRACALMDLKAVLVEFKHSLLQKGIQLIIHRKY